jgi:type II secretory pathway component PulC
MKSLAMVLRSVPVERAGTSGLVLAGSADPALLRQAGLESGDLLVSVNGTPISDVGSFASLATLTAQGLTLEIERKGQRKFHRLAIDR